MILYPPNTPIAFNISGFDIRYYGLVMAFSIFIGIAFASLFFKKYLGKKSYNVFIDFIPSVVIFSILGARFFYILGNLDFYLKNPSEILLINHGGISIYGAIIFGLAAIFIYSKKKKFNFFKFCDIIALVMPLCQACGRWGNFFNQEAYGGPYDGFLKMFISPTHRYLQYSNIEYYHPAFLYESILDLMLFFILISVYTKFKNIKAGTILFLYLLLYAIIRIFVENIRIDSVLNISIIPVASLISLILIIISTSYLFLIYRK